VKLAMQRAEAGAELLSEADELLQQRFEMRTETCRLRRLSDVMREEGVERIDLLKVDVQRSEMDVLHGIDEADWSKIGQVVMEVHDRPGNEDEGRLQAIAEFLEQRGFAVVTEQEDELQGTDRYNLYAIRPERQRTETRQTIPAPAYPQVGITSTELRRYLREQLPDYMVPSWVVLLDEWPLTPNGKLDRRALPEPAIHHGEAELQQRTPTEEIVAGVWAEVLRLPEVEMEANFFDLGGHSLLATQVVSRLRAAFGVDVYLRSLFERPTVRRLAEQIDEVLKAEQGIEMPPMQRVERNGEIPLSYAQQRLWFLDQLEPESAVYNCPVAMRLHGLLNVTALEQTFSEIIQRHEVLRTTFPVCDGAPVQVIASHSSFTLEITNLSEAEEAERETSAQQLILADAQQPFDLAHGPLMRARLLRLADDDHIVLFTMHHIISDGWSKGVLVKEVIALYEALNAGLTSPLEELPVQYADYTSWQRDWLQGEVLVKQLAYWQQYLAGATAVLELPTDRVRPAVQTFRGSNERFTFSQELSQALKTLSRHEGATLFMTLLSAFQALLYRYTGQNDIIVGSPIANRNRKEIEQLIGFFVNTLVLRSHVDGDLSFRELLKQVRETALSVYAHQDLPFERLVDVLQADRSLSYHPLFQVMFVLQNAPVSELQLAGLTMQRLEMASGTAKFDLTLSINERSDSGLNGSLEYNTTLFESDRIKRMLQHFEMLLTGIVADPEQSLSKLPLLTETEKQQSLIDWNKTEIRYPSQPIVHELFETQVDSTPDHVAVVFEGQQLTYAELDARANQVARHLREMGVGPDVPVGIMMERSIEMMVGVLGILKAGGTYVPLDPAYPTDRLLFMLEDARARILVSHRSLSDRFSVSDIEVVCMDRDHDIIAAQSMERLASGVVGDNLAYVIYTSGSTGRPKGIGLSHVALGNLIEWHYSVLSRGTRTLQFASLSFDASFHEIFSAWCSGGTLFIVPEWVRADMATLMRFITDARVEKAILPVVVLQQLAEKYKSQPQLFAGIRELITTGEQLQITTPIVDLFRQLDHCTLYNHYGPSESHVVTAYTLAQEPLTWASHPAIGRPISNTQIYILDQFMNPVPVGVPGELYIGGVALARGYINRPDVTAEKFIPDPFSSEPGARLYKTGDQCRYLPDGNIEYLGRIDHQVKIRGFRVELGEVESVLGQHPAVQESVVMVREDTPGNRRLVAYVIADTQEANLTSQLQTFLREQLPEYMLPSAFVLLDEFPLTANGKVDRRALPVPDKLRPEAEEDYVGPRNAAEEIVTGIWMQVLDIEKVGVHHNFFRLGGHSLLATQVISRMRSAFQLELDQLPLRQLFETPTIAGLVEALTRIWGGMDVIDNIAQTLKQLEQLSDEEVELLLSEQ
jgi:amino acid adenylation domain-containing protein